ELVVRLYWAGLPIVSIPTRVAYDPEAPWSVLRRYRPSSLRYDGVASGGCEMPCWYCFDSPRL
ncbi:MAG: hypothetical protein V3R72_12965, partial [Gammaproteobacteria bacterium]